MNEQLPYQLSTHYGSLLNKLGAAASKNSEAACYFAAINRQCTPTSAEEHIEKFELTDPLGAHLYHVTPRLVHQYKNRCLLLTTSICFSYCRFCFRRNYAGHNEGFISDKEIEDVCVYLAAHAEITEILLSGGDPLTATDEKLLRLISAIRKARPGILIRICTRAPVFAPERFTVELITLLKKSKPLWIIPHINHPAEISKEWAPNVRKLLFKLSDYGLQLQSQTVLLRGINDSVSVLSKLFTDLVALGVKPGYLFQLDLAEGTSHFRVPLQEGMELYNDLKKELSGLSLPTYAVDLPGGGGKVNIMNTKFVKDQNSWKYTDENGKDWFYPL